MSKKAKKSKSKKVDPNALVNQFTEQYQKDGVDLKKKYKELFSEAAPDTVNDTELKQAIICKLQLMGYEQAGKPVPKSVAERAERAFRFEVDAPKRKADSVGDDPVEARKVRQSVTRGPKQYTGLYIVLAHEGDNPRRANTNSYENFKLYETGKMCDQYFKEGGKTWFLAQDVEKKRIALVDHPPTEDDITAAKKAYEKVSDKPKPAAKPAATEKKDEPVEEKKKSTAKKSTAKKKAAPDKPKGKTKKDESKKSADRSKPAKKSKKSGKTKK